MLLRELNIGDRFKIKDSHTTIWIKRNEQGKNNDYSYCETSQTYTTRCHRQSTKQKLFDQSINVIRIYNE